MTKPTLTAALALAALTAPLILANLPLPERPALDKEARRDRWDRLVRAVAFTGGALLAGAEGPGLTADALAHADVTVRIPIDPASDSLNVVVAVSIALQRLQG